VLGARLVNELRQQRLPVRLLEDALDVVRILVDRYRGRQRRGCLGFCCTLPLAPHHDTPLPHSSAQRRSPSLTHSARLLRSARRGPPSMRGLCAVVGGRSVPARRAVVMFDCAAWQCTGVRAYAAIRPSRIWCVHTARQQTSRPTPPAPPLAEPWRSSRRTSDDLRCSPSGSYCGTAHPPRTNGIWRHVSTLVSVRRSCPAIAVTGSTTGRRTHCVWHERAETCGRAIHPGGSSEFSGSRPRPSGRLRQR